MSHTNLIGRPWVANAQGPDSFDCWGLVRYWFRTQHNVVLPATPVDGGDIRAVIEGLGALERDAHVWAEVPLGEAGQVVAMGKNSRVSHVGVHIGGSFVLHSSRESGMVVVQTVSQLQRRWGTLKIYQYKG